MRAGMHSEVKTQVVESKYKTPMWDFIWLHSSITSPMHVFESDILLSFIFVVCVCVCVCVCVRACVTEYDHCVVLGTVDKYVHGQIY